MLDQQRNAFWGGDAFKMPKYEATVFNKAVRQKVQDGEHHQHYTDDWADFRYIEIRAENEEQARARLEERYPANRGFVIDSLTEQKASLYD